MTLSFICPNDRHPLSEISSDLSCAECGRLYSIRDGVVCTLDQPDDFYEGTYQSTTLFSPQSERPRHVWPLWLINSGYPWTVRHFVRRRYSCGARLRRRLRYFGQRYRMVGCDLSYSSLKKVDSMSEEFKPTLRCAFLCRITLRMR